MHIGALGMQLLFKFIFCIANQTQEAASIPEHGSHISCIHPRESAVNTAYERVPLLVLFCQPVLSAECIMGELQARPVPLPADLQVPD